MAEGVGLSNWVARASRLRLLRLPRSKICALAPVLELPLLTRAPKAPIFGEVNSDR